MKIWIILACTPNQGIGYQNKIPWNCKNDLKYFKRFTSNHTIIMGRKTYESIGKPLPNRYNIVVSSNPINDDKICNVASIEEGITVAKRRGTKILWVCGGSSIYDYFMVNFKIDGFVITNVPDFKCDTFIRTNIQEHLLMYNYHKEFETKELETGYVMNVYSNDRYRTVDDDYMDLLNRITENGERRETRNGTTLSIFSEKISVDLSQGFPLLTTKKVFFNGIVHELLWFLKGQTDSKILEQNKVNIWKGNTTKEFLEKTGLPYQEGIGGPIYGFQWRHFGERYEYEQDNIIHFTKGLDKGFDQLQFIIDEIKSNPNSRRLYMSGWNPNQMEQMCLPPCHVSYQFYVQNGKISCQMYQRSADVFLGLPFNIASTALLTHLIAKTTNLVPDKVHICIGDAHLYDEHLDAVKEQIGRKKYLLPEVEIIRRERMEDYEFGDISLKNYESHSLIRAKMIA